MWSLREARGTGELSGPLCGTFLGDPLNRDDYRCEIRLMHGRGTSCILDIRTTLGLGQFPEWSEAELLIFLRFLTRLSSFFHLCTVENFEHLQMWTKLQNDSSVEL